MHISIETPNSSPAGTYGQNLIAAGPSRPCARECGLLSYWGSGRLLRSARSVNRRMQTTREDL
jgi:hypothetical protein